jgi:protein-tyrosine-phosphatase
VARATVERLTALGIRHEADRRNPLPVTTDDLVAADLVVALKEAEHRRLLTERHPAWADRVEYWHVHDIDFATPDEALPHVEREVLSLVTRLATAGDRVGQTKDP